MKAYFPFEDAPVIAIATSGGADSLGLILLADEWSRSKKSPSGTSIVGLTVDHGLRPNSTSEARLVQEWLKKRDIQHHILTWEGTKPTSKIQNSAREARYDLLSQWCLKNNVLHLLTGHHATDQLETFLMRLSKGSGLKGLTGIQKEVFMPFGRLIRPFLEENPLTIKLALNRFGQDHIEDPSNQNIQFERTRWRKVLPLLEEQSLTTTALNKTLNKLQSEQNVLEKEVTKALIKCFTVEMCGLIRIDKKIFTKIPRQIGHKLLEKGILSVSGHDYGPKKESLQNLYDGLIMGKKIPLTLSGCRIMCRKKEIIIGREYEALKNTATTLHNNLNCKWDNKFQVRVKKAQITENLIIRALGPEGLKQLREKNIPIKYKDIPQPLLLTLPSVWKNNEIISIPHLTWKDLSATNISIFIELCPKRRLTEN